jgi:hypothetical protein
MSVASGPMLGGLRQGLREFGNVERHNLPFEQHSDGSISVRYAHLDINTDSILHAVTRRLLCRTAPCS